MQGERVQPGLDSYVALAQAFAAQSDYAHLEEARRAQPRGERSLQLQVVALKEQAGFVIHRTLEVDFVNAVLQGFGATLVLKAVQSLQQLCRGQGAPAQVAGESDHCSTART